MNSTSRHWMMVSDHLSLHGVITQKTSTRNFTATKASKLESIHNSPPYSNEREPISISDKTGWKPEPVWTWCWRETSYTLPGFEPKCPEHRQSKDKTNLCRH
jgi:hypothetical protein